MQISGVPIHPLASANNLRKSDPTRSLAGSVRTSAGRPILGAKRTKAQGPPASLSRRHSHARVRAVNVPLCSSREDKGGSNRSLLGRVSCVHPPRLISFLLHLILAPD